MRHVDVERAQLRFGLLVSVLAFEYGGARFNRTLGAGIRQN